MDNLVKDSGVRQVFAAGGQRDTASGKGRMDLLPDRAMIELSRLFEAGAVKYGESNWSRGINTHCYVDSMRRHLSKFLLGQDDEPHLTQACWNAMCLLDTILRIKDGTLPDIFHDLPVSLDRICLFTTSTTPPPEIGNV
jgi:hypothetical protein